MLNIYITRHGETEWNKEYRLQGWKDSKLTDKGKKDALSLGERLSRIDIDAIYTSPSERACHTASLIRSGKDIPLHKIEHLREINFGDWEGKTEQEITLNDGIEYYNFWNNPHLYNHEPHNGESLVYLKERVDKAFRKIVEENVDGNILIVTHAVVIRAILSLINNIPTKDLWEPPFIKGASLTLFQWDGTNFIEKMLGDTDHLDS